MEESSPIIQSKGKNDRSAAYPAISIKNAIECSKKIISTYPKSNFDRESAAKAMGYISISGPSASKIAALVQYGLLNRKNNAYSNSELAQKITYSMDKQEKSQGIIEAVKRPKLFKALIEEYNGRAIPTTLSNVLIRQHKISNNVVGQVEKIFKDSIEFAGIYPNGIVNSTQENNSDKIGKAIETDSSVDTVVGGPSKMQLNSTESGMYRVKLPSGAIISYPEDIAFFLQTNPEYLKILEEFESIVKVALSKKNNNNTQ